jgi:hypothetical protein
MNWGYCRLYTQSRSLARSSIQNFHTTHRLSSALLLCPSPSQREIGCWFLVASLFWDLWPPKTQSKVLMLNCGLGKAQNWKSSKPLHIAWPCLLTRESDITSLSTSPSYLLILYTFSDSTCLSFKISETLHVCLSFSLYLSFYLSTHLFTSLYSSFSWQLYVFLPLFSAFQRGKLCSS